MIKYGITFFLFASISFLNDNDCLEKNLNKENYYTKGRYIMEGYELGNGDLYISFEDNITSDKLLLKVYEITADKDTLPIKGVNCSIAGYNKSKAKFKYEKFLGGSNDKGEIYLDKNLDTEFVVIDFPGYSTKVIRYKEFLNCLGYNNIR